MSGDIVKARKVTDLECDSTRLPGAYHFRLWPDTDQVGGMAFMCPCGCGFECWIALENDQLEARPGAMWKWNGNEDKPTLTPSVFNTGLKCKWHGWLSDGEWKPC